MIPRPFLTGLILIFTAATSVNADVCQVRVLLYIPSDLDVPKYQERLNDTVAYAEEFFRQGLRHWGYKESVSPFRWNDDHAEVLLVRGTKTSQSCTDPSIRTEAIDIARRQYSIGEGRQIWWVFVYRGDPPSRFANYRGGFEPSIGGWSVCNFDTRAGRFRPQDLLGNEFLSELTLKGMIHELGHAFQLPHIGPRVRDRSGNTLMGPTHANYRRIIPRREPRVYLSEAAAAMLVNHPAFRGEPDSRGRLPQVQVTDQNYEHDRTTSSFVVSGRVKATVEPAFAVVADESKARPGEYWTKHYVGSVTPDGRYRVRVNELPRSGGTLKTWFIFKNGATTGNGRRRGKAGAVTQQYERAGQTYRFQ